MEQRQAYGGLNPTAGAERGDTPLKSPMLGSGGAAFKVTPLVPKGCLLKLIKWRNGVQVPAGYNGCRESLCLAQG